MKICAVQYSSIKGDIEENLRRHLLLTSIAASKGADLIIFPELSLTGYEPSIVKDLATDASDPRLSALQKLSNEKKIAIGVGLPIQADRGIKIGLLIFRPGLPIDLYTKQTLHSDELPYFVSGDQDIVLTFDKEKIALAICYESLLSEHSDRAIALGATIYFASVAKSAKGIEKANLHMPTVAKKHSVIVVMANSVGLSDNFVGFGNSAVWDERGNLLARLNDKSQGVLIYDTVKKSADLIENVVLTSQEELTDVEFMKAFLDRTLPRVSWTHEAHLRFAWMILQRFRFDEACDFAREKIDHYNQKVGFNIGYHETITKSYLRLVRERMSRSQLQSFSHFKDEHPDLFEPGLKILFAYYSKERLWAPDAKLEFIEPDLQSLP